MSEQDKPEGQEPEQQKPDNTATDNQEVSSVAAHENSQTESEQTSPIAAFNLQSVIDDALKVITNPVGFYREMPTTGGYVNPMIFVAVMAVTTALVAFIFNIVGLANVNMVVGGAVGIGMLIMVPIFSVIGSFIGGAVLYIIWKLMGSEREYEAAYRCVAYSFAIGPIIAVISFIPYIANIIKTAWGAFLMYTASVEVHNLKAQTAKIVFGVLAAISILLGLGSERTARKAQAYMDRYAASMQQEYREGTIGNALKELENAEDMTPEEAGRKMGEFLKGMEEFSKGLEESVKEQEKNQSKD